jgi:hypothetical protein
LPVIVAIDQVHGFRRPDLTFVVAYVMARYVRSARPGGLLFTKS